MVISMSNEKLTPEQIIQMAKLLSMKKKSEEEQAEMLKEFAAKNMSNEEFQKMNEILNNDKALEQLLSSKQAQMIMKLFEKKGEK
jgi:mannitol/fructose-specific phosphotransferase system IIA component (Ntr-type)